MHKLIEYVCDELEALEKKADKGSLSMAEVEYADKLAHLKKNLLKSEEMMEDFDEGYSSDVRSTDGISYNRGSYRTDGNGSYARGRGRYAKRDSMGRYSSERGYSRDYSRDAADMADKLHDLMREAPNEEVRHEIERLADRVEKM